MTEPAASPHSRTAAEHSEAPGGATVAETAEAAEERKRRRSVALARRVGITVVGVAILLAGAAMLALPGPGWLAIVLGLYVLSLEYAWAERLLDRIKDKVLDGARQAASNAWKTALSVLFSLGLIAAGIVWALEDDIPYSSWATGGVLAGSGVLALITIGWSVRDLKRRRAAESAAAR